MGKRIEVAEGRARVNLKVWTNTMTTDLTGARMSEDRATLITLLAVGPSRLDEPAISEMERALLAALREKREGE